MTTLDLTAPPCPHLAACPACARAVGDAARDKRPSPLDARQIQVLSLMAEGHTRASAARRLGLTEGGVKSRLSAAAEAAGARSATQLVAMALREGWIA